MGEVTIQNYRHPADSSVTRKGIVHFFHGAGEYAGRYGFLAQRIASHGYDVVSYDQRGFGYSEGRRGVQERQEILVSDALAHTNMVKERFGEPGLPHFSISHSFGGYITLSVLHQASDTFQGSAFVAPFTGV